MDEVQLMALDGAINILQDTEGEVSEATAQWVVEKLRDLRESFQTPKIIYVVTWTTLDTEVTVMESAHETEAGAVTHGEGLEDTKAHEGYTYYDITPVYLYK